MLHRGCQVKWKRQVLQCVPRGALAPFPLTPPAVAGEVFTYPRQKRIHSVAAHAPVKFVSSGKHAYGGLLFWQKGLLATAQASVQSRQSDSGCLPRSNTTRPLDAGVC